VRLVAITRAAIFATTTARTASAATALFARFGNVHRQSATVNTFAIERVDRGFRLFVRAHGDEAEAPRTTAVAIHHQIGLEYRAVSGKHILKIIFGRVEGKIPHEQFIITHVFDVQ